MASRRGMALLVALVMALAACTESATPPQPTAPPDAFASTPTIGPSTTTRPTPTTTLDLERVVLQRVDPVSLEPMTAFEPIPMGDALWGSFASSDGRYLVATVDAHGSGDPEMRLVDLQSWLPVASWPESGDFMFHINQQGSVFYVTYGGTAEFRFAATDSTQSTLIASLPANYGVWGAESVTEALFVLYGTKPAEPGSDHQEQVFVATVQLDEGGPVLTEIPMPGVVIGQVDPVSQGPWAGYLYTSPSFTWDPVGARLLVVHGDEDVISEVDIETGKVVEHPVAGTVDLQSGTRRMSALSPDGGSLHVATRTVELIEDDDDWMVITRPAGVKTIDTTTWEMVVRTDEPISDIWVSPSGALLGSGYTTEESESVSVQDSTGLYLLDGSNLSVRVHYPPETPDQWWGPVSFSESGAIAYASSWVQNPRVHALEMATGEFLSTAESTETLEMIGPVGVLASTR
jgi:hypothetical protein